MGKIVHKNRLFKVEMITNIKRKRYDYFKVIKRDTIVVLPFLDKKHIILERQYRPPLGMTIYEIPAGHIEKGDSPLKTVNKELEEETGYVASKIRLLTVIYPSPGVLSSKEYIFVAEGLRKTKPALEFDEDISVVKMPVDKAMKMIKSNRIKDSKTIIALLYHKYIVG